MKERVKIFTFITGHGEQLLQPKEEEQINQWLASVNGHVERITQSESVRQGIGHHITVSVWYEPHDEAADKIL
ncbi:MAG TPA: hypothetical protein VFE62_14845 [Gemmataceae bacterium]|nr:hypothetical protein [Gemmataceae bacterium]